MSNIISIKFDSFFTLDSSKLSRLLSVVEDRFKGISTEIISNYEISTKKGKTFTTGDISAILDHDNPINNPITTLSINYQDKKEKPTNIVDINFDKDDSEIKVKIETEDPKIGKDVYAEVEEQIERTKNKSWVYSIKRQKPHELLMYLILVISMPLIAISIFTAFPKDVRFTDFLSKDDALSLSKKIGNSLTEDKKIDFLYEYQAKKLTNINKQKSDFLKLFSKKNILNFKVGFLVLPFVVVLVGIFYIVKKTYLGSIFLWGDFVEHNNILTERRKLVWNAVILAIIIGIISNLFVLGFSQFF